jgi:type VI secretion system protein ImpM
VPGADLILPGFFGKLPRAGDFVGRRLPGDFVRLWDRWCARHLAAVPAARWPAGGLRFHLPGRATGVAVASRDRAGRAFPLTLAAPAPVQAEGWYGALARLAAEAAEGGLDPDALDERLRLLPARAEGAEPTRPCLWRAGGAPVELDLASPAALAALLGEAEGAACGR